MASMAPVLLLILTELDALQQMQGLMLHLYSERYNFNRQLLCRPLIFQGHVGGGENKDLPENSRLDQVELQFGGKRDCCRRRVERKF